MYISFTGLDGSGKTTQLNRFMAHLESRGVRVSRVKEPGETTLGSQIRESLLSKEFYIPPVAELLLYAADRALTIDVIKARLSNGYWVVSDRCSDCSIAYQGYGRGVSVGLINKLNTIATEGTIPALTFWLDIDPELAMERIRQSGNADRIESMDLEFFKRVRQGYSNLHLANQSRIKRINAELPEDAVFDSILNVLNDFLRNKG